MAQVNVSIGSKQYRMACEDGQEERLVALAARLDRSINELRGRFGEIGDQRLTVMAAIAFADRQGEAERKLAAAEARLSEGEGARAAIAEEHDEMQGGVADALATLADRIERLAERVSGSGVEDEE